MERISEINLVQAELDAVNAQNARLMEENAQLRGELQRVVRDQRSKSTVNVEARLQAFQYENERDQIYEQLEKMKRKYNQLHQAFVAKVKRCKALEDVFNRQKTLNGLVLKSETAQRQKENSLLVEQRSSEYMEKSTIASLEERVVKLQNELEEARDIIDELEFELESIDILEMENQRLQEELKTYKKEKLKLRTTTNLYPGAQTIPEETEAPPEYREFEGINRFQTDSMASSLADSIAGDMDPETMERAALTDSLIQMAQAESNCLRRELLRSRLRRTVKGERPTSTDV